MEYLKKLAVKKTVNKKAVLGGQWYDEIIALERLMNALEEFYDTETNEYALRKKKPGSPTYSQITLDKIKDIEDRLRKIYPELVQINNTISFE